MARIAEDTHQEFCAGQPKPVYIIGTEVPIPGGAQEEEEMVSPSLPSDVVKTIEITKAAFEAAGVSDAWNRVCGVVVQPGVEFGDDQVFHYNSEAAQGLSEEIMKQENLIYEAHSTDYQSESGLKKLVRDHYCILKVGPWLTFGYREALFALSMIEEEIAGQQGLKKSNLREVMERTMVEDPTYWKKYYPGDEFEQAFKRKYSFSDRSRYYWPNGNIQKAVSTLVSNLKESTISLSLLSQYMPHQYIAINEGIIENDVEQIIIHRTQEVIRLYARACNMRNAVN